MQLQGFPDIGPLVTELQTLNATGAACVQESTDYQVSVPQPDGSLIVKEYFFEMFSESITEFWDIMNSFNKKYNKENRRLLQRNTEPTQESNPHEKADTVPLDESTTAQSINSMPDAPRT